jgi:hypothetical protein
MACRLEAGIGQIGDPRLGWLLCVCSWVSTGGIFGPIFTSDFWAKIVNGFFEGGRFLVKKIGEFFGRKILEKLAFFLFERPVF